MDETIQETDDTAPSQKEKWKSFSPEKYDKMVRELVHFRSKTVNSNAKLVGIRLASDAAFEAPYVAARTLMARGVSLTLDHSGYAKVNALYTQVNAVLHDDTFAKQASPVERAAIEKAVTQTEGSGFCVGTDFVDHRLRQILIPRKGAEGDYVSLTPITASGLCELLFAEENGLVTRHNATVAEDRKRNEKAEESRDVQEAPRSERRKLYQAQFRIGGSKPQNVGGLVRSMQRPLFVDAPHRASNLEIAFSVYYQGISLDFSKPGVLREALEVYAGFRRRHRLDEEVSPVPGSTHMEVRQEEEDIIINIAKVVLQLAGEAGQLLLEYTGMLPSEYNPETGTPALVSPKLEAVMRGLFDRDLRDAEWSRNMAWCVLDKMEKAVRSNENKYLILDQTAEATVAGYLEEALR